MRAEGLHAGSSKQRRNGSTVDSGSPRNRDPKRTSPTPTPTSVAAKMTARNSAMRWNEVGFLPQRAALIRECSVFQPWPAMCGCVPTAAISSRCLTPNTAMEPLPLLDRASC